MGLEVATWISQLVTTNPVASDKKNQGDDHLRLLKNVLQATFPNGSRAFRFPELAIKSGTGNVVDADDGKLLFCDMSGGSMTLTLPVAPPHVGWQVTIMKGGVSANVVFVAAGSIFTALGSITRARVDVPAVPVMFYWTGATYVKLDARESPVGQLLPFGGTTPNGFQDAIGQSLSRVDYPELFLAWGTTYGAIDGASFNAPNARDRVLIGAGNAYVLGATGGVTGVTIAQANLPNYVLPDTLSITDPGHAHTTTLQHSVIPPSGGIAIDVLTNTVGTADAVKVSSTTAAPLQRTGSVFSGGSGTPLSTLPPYLAQNYIFRSA